MKNCLALLFLLFGFQINSVATSVSSEAMHCPSCEKEYERLVIQSWNYMISNGAHPPKPSGQCPYCLYHWNGTLDKLDALQKKKQRGGLALLRSSYRPKDRQLILQGRPINDSFNSEHLKQWGEWIRGDRKSLKVLSLKKQRSKRSWAEKRALKKKAKRVLTYVKDEKPSLSELQSLLKKEVFLGYVADLIDSNDPEVTALFLTVLLYASDEKLYDSSYVFVEISDKLSAIPFAKWPTLPPVTKHTKLAMESLRYLRGERSWGRDFDRVIVNTKQQGMANWLIACATTKRDRSPSKLLNQLMFKEKHWQLSEMYSDYYTRVGVEKDLPILGRAHQKWLSKSKGLWQWEIYDAITPELHDAMLNLRLRLILEN